ncbi:MAG: metal-dependent hydrolase [Candidatus Nanohaloarchaea archaeon]|nr:metal-dependent hydrolase [Candidatus Nanohaloarchaea archaeon]
MIGTTHLLFAFALVYLLGLPVVYGMVGGVLPDIDLLMEAGFPFTHRGIVHTPIAASAVAAALFLATGKQRPPASLLIGYLSHLFLDTFTYSGVHWFYPVRSPISFELAGYADPATNLGIILFSLLLPAGWRYRHEVRRWLR